MHAVETHLYRLVVVGPASAPHLLGEGLLARLPPLGCSFDSAPVDGLPLRRRLATLLPAALLGALFNLVVILLLFALLDVGGRGRASTETAGGGELTAAVTLAGELRGLLLLLLGWRSHHET